MEKIYPFNNLIKALTIQERYQIIKEHFPNIAMDIHSLQNWREGMSILSEEEFQLMLKQNNYEKEIFTIAVKKQLPKNIHIKLLEFVEKSSWYLLLKNIFSKYKESALIKKDSFSYILRPFIYYTCEEIQLIVKQFPRLTHKDFVKNMQKTYEEIIIQKAEKTLVYELNIRKHNQMLTGDDPHAKYINFLSYFDDINNIARFLDKYIVLTRLLLHGTENFIQNVQLILKRLMENQPFLKEVTNIGSDTIFDISFNQGDFHNKGQTVATIYWNNGSKCVYKPKISFTDTWINRIIDMLKKWDSSIHLKPIKTIERENYAFQEYIEHDKCPNHELHHYYEAAGELLALLYMVNATDIHMENVIAAGNQPWLVDTETILQQPVHFFGNHSINNLINENLFLNVTSTAFLPKIIGASMDEIDVSALKGGQIHYPVKVKTLVNDKTDNIRYEEKYILTKDAKNIPNNKVNLCHYIKSIIHGFCKIYDIILNNKKYFSEHLLSDFLSMLNVRIIFRNTQFYHDLLNHLLHPDLLTDMLEREKVLENIWSYNIFYKEIILSEYNQLLFHDIPIFYLQVENNNVIDGEKNIITNRLQYNSLLLFRKKMGRLSFGDKRTQCELIQLSINRTMKQVKTVSPPANDTSNQYTSFDYINEAIKIAETIIQTALQDGTRITWINYTDDIYNVLAPINDSFYNGTAGIAFFLLKLYEKTNDKNYYSFARRLIQGIQKPEKLTNIGISGELGLLYSYSYLTSRYDFMEEKLSAFNGYHPSSLSLEKYLDTDYINGALGLLSLYVRLYKSEPNSSNRKACRLIANWLQEKLPNEIIQNNGFGHGVLSYVFIFHHLGRLLNNTKYIIFSRNLFANYEEKFVDNNSWCNGRVGTEIGKILVNQSFERSEKPSINGSFPAINLLDDDCLCHGNAGLLELFCLLYEYTGDESYYREVMKITNFMLKRKEATGKYELLDIQGYTSVGLFTGVAGIGYQLLRISDLKNTPSLLIG
ncbi:type 2 lanthipeptide synthetase LanM [Bacillus kwashiorkori]|uniref:type 2 lanthipeptide synthetase LanM n=1 Tax=Bacillus kwashiorkori TaxID=1522318 RepID=UPI001EF06073|nr:type 2 lanthipeptide synthetase LanM [Bacillus kwashiorkori]